MPRSSSGVSPMASNDLTTFTFSFVSNLSSPSSVRSPPPVATTPLPPTRSTEGELIPINVDIEDDEDDEDEDEDAGDKPDIPTDAWVMHVTCDNLARMFDTVADGDGAVVSSLLDPPASTTAAIRGLLAF